MGYITASVKCKRTSVLTNELLMGSILVQTGGKYTASTHTNLQWMVDRRSWNYQHRLATSILFLVFICRAMH